MALNLIYLEAYDVWVCADCGAILPNKAWFCDVHERFHAALSDSHRTETG